MCQTLNMSVFYNFQDCQYAWVLNFQVYTGLFTYFRKYDRVLNMCRDAIMGELWIIQKSEYGNLSAYARVKQGSQFAWTWLNNAWINCSDYGKVLNMPGQSFRGFDYACGSKYARVQNMARLRNCEGCIGFWICLNKPEFSLIMPKISGYTSIILKCLNLSGHIWKKSSEYARIPNVSDAVHS